MNVMKKLAYVLVLFVALIVFNLFSQSDVNMTKENKVSSVLIWSESGRVDIYNDEGELNRKIFGLRESNQLLYIKEHIDYWMERGFEVNSMSRAENLTVHVLLIKKEP
jgi:hypothetical protein